MTAATWPPSSRPGAHNRPMNPAIEMVGFDGDHQKYSLSDYTQFATKAVEIRNRLRQQKGEDKPKSRLRQYLEPLWKADSIVVDEEDDMYMQKE